ncbi:MAG: hypothetical protein U9O98_10920 [Asgard group archaeon]|nr:hypothetical protein [Asgard group archaeon]
MTITTLEAMTIVGLVIIILLGLSLLFFFLLNTLQKPKGINADNS